jgi:hypothetical protein
MTGIVADANKVSLAEAFYMLLRVRDRSEGLVRADLISAIRDGRLWHSAGTIHVHKPHPDEVTYVRNQDEPVRSLPPWPSSPSLIMRDQPIPSHALRPYRVDRPSTKVEVESASAHWREWIEDQKRDDPQTGILLVYKDIVVSWDGLVKQWPEILAAAGQPEAVEQGRKRGRKVEIDWKFYEIQFFLRLYDEDVPAGKDISVNHYAEELMTLGTHLSILTPGPTAMRAEVTKWAPKWREVRTAADALRELARSCK